MTLLTATETKLVAELLARAEKRATAARQTLSTTVLSSGPAYAVRWAKDALDTEGMYNALREVESFYTVDGGDRAMAERCAANRINEKLRWICAGSSSEPEQVRDAQAYASAKQAFDEALMWASHEDKQPAKS